MIQKETYRIRNYESDSRGYLSLYALANFFQDIADRHAIELGVGMPALAEVGLSWVLHRMKINIVRWPKIAEVITIETHPSGLERVFVFRDFRVYDQSGSTIISASSTWLVFDTQKRTLTTPASHFPAIFEPYKNFSFLPRSNQKLEFLQSESPIKKIVQARNNEIDTNAHINNSVYFQWLLEPFTIDFLDTHVCNAVEIQFRKECQLEDVITSYCEEIKEGSYYHYLQNEHGKEVVVGATSWARREYQGKG